MSSLPGIACHGGSSSDGDAGGDSGSPDPEAIQTGEHPVYLATDGAYLYLADYFDKIYRLDLDGGSMEVLTTTATSPGPILVDGNDVFWAEGYELHSVTKSGGEASRGVGTFENQVQELAMDNSWIYATGACCGPVVAKIPKSGADPLAVVSTADYGAGTLAHDPAGALYYGTGTNRVMSVEILDPAEPTEPGELVSGRGTINEVATDGSWVYYATGEGTIEKTTRTGGGAPVTLASRPSSPFGFAVASDGTSVYWHDRDTDELLRVGIDGGPVTTVATGQGEEGWIVDIVFVGDTVYWVADFEVWRARRANGSPGADADAGASAIIDAGGGECTAMSTPLGGTTCEAFLTCPTYACHLDCDGASCTCYLDDIDQGSFTQGDACASTEGFLAAKDMCSCFP